jgi:hypothetical protein
MASADKQAIPRSGPLMKMKPEDSRINMQDWRNLGQYIGLGIVLPQLLKGLLSAVRSSNTDE